MKKRLRDLWEPFKNATHFLLTEWHFTGSNIKSALKTNQLLNSITLHNDFSITDAATYNLDCETKQVDNYDESTCLTGNGWKEATVKIPLPCKTMQISEGKAAQFEVEGVHYHNLLGVIISAFESKEALSFTGTPFVQWWKPSDDEDPMWVYGELYTLDVMLEAQAEVDKISVDDPTIENIVASIMLWSDSTHLANFGTASLWPVYLFFGNQSKYTQAKPTSFAAHHVAYMPSVCIHTIISSQCFNLTLVDFVAPRQLSRCLPSSL